MLSQNNIDKISELKLNATENALSTLIEETAGLAGSFEVLENICNDGYCLLDAGVLGEIRKMLGVMNRLLCEQSGRLEHLGMMRDAHMEAGTAYADLKKKALAAEERVRRSSEGKLDNRMS